MAFLVVTLGTLSIYLSFALVVNGGLAVLQAVASLALGRFGEARKLRLDLQGAQ